jgi:hypothetical protein
VKKLLLTGVAVAAVSLCNGAEAADANMPAKVPAACRGTIDPYKNYACLDAYLGTTFWERLFNYYRLEWGHDASPTDPKAPPARRDYWPPTPESVPPQPFAEWVMGGNSYLGTTRPNSVDSPLMAALGNTAAGKAMSENNIQIYGWINPGGNLSNNTVRGGNAPVAYAYNPNTVQLDQAVIYFERLPDTVQKDHIDWGFRIAPIYGENYRYTTAYGIFSSQLLNQNLNNGFDLPMVYGEVFIPQVMEGLLIRVGRFISPPDIEAQLAPNNYTYVHSMTYSYDNYTNSGVLGTLALDKNWMVQLGVSVGTEAAPWHYGAQIANPFPNQLYPNNTMPKDPGAVPALTASVRWTNDSGSDNLYLLANGIDGGQWGYNNLQWLGITYFHKFNDQWHIGVESYNLSQNNVLNANNPAAVAAFNAGGTPFSPQYMPFNAPNLAQCSNPALFSCKAEAVAFLVFTNYSPTKLDNITLRTEYYDDMEGQRTGIKTDYFATSLSWQHWFSPQIEIRPEFSFTRSLKVDAFNGNSNLGIAPNKNTALIGAADVIFHF